MTTKTIFLVFAGETNVKELLSLETLKMIYYYMLTRKITLPKSLTLRSIASCSCIQVSNCFWRSGWVTDCSNNQPII